MKKTFEYFVVQASGEFLTKYFPSEDMSEEERIAFCIDTVCEQYENTLPDELLRMITCLADVLEGIYETGYDEGVASFNQ